MDNAQAKLRPDVRKAVQHHSLFDVLYADDTITLGTMFAFVEEFAAAEETAGAEFGMTLNCERTQVLSICSDDKLCSPDGEIITDTGALTYLGELISAGGRADSELS